MGYDFHRAAPSVKLVVTEILSTNPGHLRHCRKCMFKQEVSRVCLSLDGEAALFSCPHARTCAGVDFAAKVLFKVMVAS